MVSDAISAGEEGDKVLRDVERLDGADAKPRERRLVKNAAKKIENIRARRKIATPGAEVDAAEDDFLKAGTAETADLGENRIGREAAAFSTDERNDTERATIVATVLNFENGASVIPFPAEKGGDKDIMDFENISHQKCRRRGRKRLRSH